jgi:hypothetical protein
MKETINEDIYYPAARNFLRRYNITASEHIVDIIVSVMRTRDNVGWQGGDFVQSIVSNNLTQSVLRADNDCINHLKTFVLAKQNCYPKEELAFHLVPEKV